VRRSWLNICAQEPLIADKGYDSDAFVQEIRATGAKVVIPPRSNRKTKRRYDRELYRTRNLVEFGGKSNALYMAAHTR
jgi:transposase